MDACLVLLPFADAAESIPDKLQSLKLPALYKKLFFDYRLTKGHQTEYH